jgi:hypothetical protein
MQKEKLKMFIRQDPVEAFVAAQDWLSHMIDTDEFEYVQTVRSTTEDYTSVGVHYTMEVTETIH